MILSLDDIEIFTSCPRYYWFRQKSDYIGHKDSKTLSIVKKLISRSYIRRTEYFKKVEWRVLTGWLDKEIFKDVDITNPMELKNARQMAENILIFLRKWYYSDYLRNDDESFIDVPFSYSYCSNELREVIPLVHSGENLTISMVGDIEMNNIKMYNNIKIMAMGWLAINELGLDKVNIKYLYFGPGSAFKKTQIEISPKKCSNIKSIIQQVLMSVSNKINYPSKTEQCLSCEFKKYCTI